MVRPEYIPPNFDANSLEPVPFSAIGGTALLPGMIINGIGGFNDLTPVERNVVRSMSLPETGTAERPRLDYPGVYDMLWPQLPLPLSEVLRPKQARCSIVEGSVALLPFEDERVARYAPQVPKLAAHTLLSLVFTGRLSSRGEATQPFAQEISYVVTRGRTLKRFVAPTDALKQAALTLSSINRTGRRVADSTDVHMRGVHHPGQHRPQGDDGAPGKRRP
jgi:hypothetical protein